jgi:hypothetical protein
MHTSAYVSIRQHTPAYVSCTPVRGIWRVCASYSRAREELVCQRSVPLAASEHSRRTETTGPPPAYVSIRQHPSAYVSIRQHSSAFVSIRQHTTSAYVCIRLHTSAYVCIRLHSSAYVCIRQHTYARGAAPIIPLLTYAVRMLTYADVCY